MVFWKQDDKCKNFPPKSVLKKTNQAKSISLNIYYLGKFAHSLSTLMLDRNIYHTLMSVW